MRARMNLYSFHIMFCDISNSSAPRPLSYNEGMWRVRTPSLRDPFNAASVLVLRALDMIAHAPSRYKAYNRRNALDLTSFTFARKLAGIANIERPARTAREVFYRDCFETLPANRGQFSFNEVLSYIKENYKTLCRGYPESDQAEFHRRIEKLLNDGVFDRASDYELHGTPPTCTVDC